MTARRSWEFFVSPSAFGSRNRTAVSARGTRVRFADGSQLLCATSGLWNVNLGYGHHRIADAVARALREASYLTLFRYGHEPAERAAAALVGLAGADHYGRVLFSTSGSAAIDAVMKLARHYWLIVGEPQRRLVVGLRGSYHGLTYGSFALTGEDLGQLGYGVDQRQIRHVAHDDISELRTLLGREGPRVAAVVVEPVLGSGAHALAREFVDELAKLRLEHGFLLVADEVATGFGRLGDFFVSQHWSVRPDVLVVSKGLTNGTCAASALIISAAVCAAFDETDSVFVHGETQAGSPPTCAAILATIDAMRDEDILQRARVLGGWLETALRELADDHPMVSGLSGLGCFRALHLRNGDGSTLAAAEVARVVDAVRDAGAIVHPGPSCIQLVPPLIYSSAEVEELMSCLRRGLAGFTGCRQDRR